MCLKSISPYLHQLGKAFFAFIHINITRNPNLVWVRQQLRYTFIENIPKYLLSDNEPVFRALKGWLLETMQVRSVFTAPHSPWKNPYAERWIRTCREEFTNHIIPLSENYLRQSLQELAEHYNEDRGYMLLNKSPPCKRKRQVRKKDQVLVSIPKVAGLHCKYEWRDIA